MERSATRRLPDGEGPGAVGFASRLHPTYDLVIRGYLDSRFAELEAKFETRLAQVQNRILASQVALFILLGVAILLK